MSFYGHPYVITPQGYYFAGAPARQASPAQQQAAQQQPQRATPEALARASPDALAAEERQALAYLQSVRRRREAAEAAMALESAERQRAAAEREQALRAAAERHNALIQAAKRERAVREALERERAREAAFQQAMAARQAQQVQAAIEAERRRQTMAAEAYARALGEHRQRAQGQGQAQARAHPAPKTPAPTLAQTPAAAAAATPQREVADDEIDLDGINALLGQLFGFNLATEPTEAPPAPKPKKEIAPKPQPEAPKEAAPVVTKEEPAAPAAAAPVTEAAAKPATPKATDDAVAAPVVPATKPEDDDDTPALPEDLNELLNQFLGLNVAPAAPEERGNPKASQQLVGNAVGDLNAFLAQYGLEFVPESESDSEDEAAKADEPKVTNEAGWAALPAENDKNARSAATEAALADPAAPTEAATATTDAPAVPAAADAPAPPKERGTRPRQASREPDEDAPFTSTLGSYQNLPPYLRDILSQMEAAMCEEHSDDCGCDDATRTACAHGVDGMPCAAHRQKCRRDRAAAKKRAAKERREARRSKKFSSAQEETDAAGIPVGASAEDTFIHHDVYEQAAAAGKAVEAEAAAANLSAQETREEAIPKDEPGYVVDEHRDAAAAAAAAGTSGLHKPEPVPEPSQAAVDAKEAKEEAIPANATAASVAEHRAVADAAAATPHSTLHADAPEFHPKSETKPAKAKKAAAPSSPEAAAALQKLDAISQQLRATCDKFTFPRHLSFSPSLADATQPPLLYTRNNHAYHAQAHSLMQLLLAVDGVQSHGDKAVRQRRKAVVKEIEGALNALEKGRDQKWAEVKARRERGGSDDDDDWVMTGETTDATSETEA